MSELDRFFRQLVTTLAAADPAGLSRPVSIAEIRSTLLPYRTFRRILEFDTSEDYELTLLRLCAGEGGYCSMEPGDPLTRFQAELASPNPDLGVLDAGADSHVTLAPRRIAEAMDPVPRHDPYAPPVAAAPGDPDDALLLDEVRAPAPPPKHAAAPDAEDEAVSGGEPCSFCGGSLPTGRTVNFCPHCGQSQGMTHCPGCGSEVEIGWRYCITCGYTLTA